MYVFFHSGQATKDFNPAWAKRVGSREEEGGSSDEDVYSPSGGGILVFSPDKAGLDVTPANFNFGDRTTEKRSSTGAFSQLTGQWGQQGSSHVIKGQDK